MDGLAQDHTFNIKELRFGNSLAVQWLGLSAFTAVAQVQSLVGELRSPQAMRCSQKEKKKKEKKA